VIVEKKKIRDKAETMRDEMVRRSEIISILRQGPKTVRDLAETMNEPVHEVTMWLMAMRRYGLVDELPKGRADDYFQYQLSEKESK
jgi:predicted Rossmann fold nucleotide-binding protein DprA/Smf involved in DNA uptake